MLTLISPAKTMDFSGNPPDLPLSAPTFTREAAYLVSLLKKLSVTDLAHLMKINRKRMGIHPLKEWHTAGQGTVKPY